MAENLLHSISFLREQPLPNLGFCFPLSYREESFEELHSVEDLKTFEDDLEGKLGRIISPATLRVLIGKKSDPYEYLKLLILEVVFRFDFYYFFG